MSISASNTAASQNCFDRKKSKISPLINTDDTDCRKNRRTDKNLNRSESESDENRPRVPRAMKSDQPLAGCGRIGRVNLSYHFESKVRNLLGGSQVHIDVANRRHFKGLQFRYLARVMAVMFLAASPLCVLKM